MLSSKAYKTEESDMKVCRDWGFHLFFSDLVPVSEWKVLS